MRVTFQLLDYDAKRMHYFEQLFHATEGWVSATSENMSLHVDMAARRPRPSRGCRQPVSRRMRAAHARIAASGSGRPADRHAGERLSAARNPSQLPPSECHLGLEIRRQTGGAPASSPANHGTRHGRAGQIPARSRRFAAGAPDPAASPRARARRGAPGYLADLNPEQREAVETLDGPVLVLAGAGTGKTRVLTTRIAHILATGRARPGEILAVTFTNKAAREMKERVGAMVGQVVEGMPWLGTFHSIGVKILRRHAELVGLKSDFTILDTDDQIRLIKQLLEAENIDEKRWPARVLAGADRQLEEPRAHARRRCRRRGRELRRRQGQEALRGLSGAAEGAQRRRFRRPAAGDASGCSASSPTCCASTSSASATSWSTSIRTPTWRSISGCGCWGSRRARAREPGRHPSRRRAARGSAG